MTITEQALNLADEAEAEEKHAPEPSARDDPAAVSMATAHRTDDIRHHLARASQRMQAARAASSPGQRAEQGKHLARHLRHALKAAHGLAENLRAHYPDEGRELDAVAGTVGLAKAVSDNARAATTGHLTETLLHEAAHASRHARQMLEDTPDDEFSFNWDHAAKHLKGAIEHAVKLRQHLIDNYAPEGHWLTELDRIASGEERDDNKQDSEAQHAKYGKEGAPGNPGSHLAGLGTISGQMQSPTPRPRP